MTKKKNNAASGTGTATAAGRKQGNAGQAAALALSPPSSGRVTRSATRTGKASLVANPAPPGRAAAARPTTPLPPIATPVVNPTFQTLSSSSVQASVLPPPVQLTSPPAQGRQAAGTLSLPQISSTPASTSASASSLSPMPSKSPSAAAAAALSPQRPLPGRMAHSSTTASSSSSTLAPVMMASAALRQLSPVRRYSTADDRTMTAAQATAGGFATAAIADAIQGKAVTSARIRNPSGESQEGHATGNHEGIMPTDMIVATSKRTIGKKGKSSFNTKGSKNALGKMAGVEFLEANVAPMLRASDGARTSTSGTTLSVPGGGAAGHSGSNVRTTGQAAAHDHLRQQSMNMLQTPGLTERVAGIGGAAIAVMSIAPGQDASKVENAKKLKRVRARTEYEDMRNQSKYILSRQYKESTPHEQSMIMSAASTSLKALNNPARHMWTEGPSTPPRDPKGSPGAAISGGGYMPPLALPPPAVPVASSTSSNSSSLSSSSSPRQAAAAATSSKKRARHRALAATSTASSASTTIAAASSQPDARELALEATAPLRVLRRK